MTPLTPTPATLRALADALDGFTVEEATYDQAIEALREAAASLDTLTKEQVENPPCNRCGGPHPYDTVVPSVEWNEVIRGGGPEIPDYLCIACIVRAFAIANRSFHAELWGDVFNGLPISIHINNRRAQSTQRVQEENNRLRVRLSEAERGCQELRAKAEAAEALCATLRSEKEQLTKDLETGFMSGAYARLQNLQAAERELYSARSERDEALRQVERKEAAIQGLLRELATRTSQEHP